MATLPVSQPVDGNGNAITFAGFDAAGGQFAVQQTGHAATPSGQSFPVAPAVVQQAISNAAVAAGVGTAAQAIKGAPGYLSGVLVTALGTAAISIYDNASAASGTVIGYIPASTAAGTFIAFNMPAMLGITAGKVSNSPAFTVAYS